MGNFIFNPTPLEGVYIIDVKVYGDRRGFFMETYREDDFFAAGLRYRFVQDNQSLSARGTLRGLHFQKKHPQAKLVRVLSGEVFDVAVDLRKGSATYGQWTAAVLSGENRRMFMVPRGFAHGFLTLSEYAEFAYKCDDVYHPEDEGSIRWDDPDIAVAWPDAGDLILSDKDRSAPFFRQDPPEFDL
ncbi:MAG: dTDP-4-dehydrorhamnose 3,5-epimerase [Abditibacteriota bacterium]|nr:dTDP-4-dehydrorhamnose 3,5-epimerase [Abditibacteriota bacterium]